MREQQRQTRPTRYFDYNQPTGRCKVCSTLSGWHCYDCGGDFCQNHFEHHKDNHFCGKNWETKNVSLDLANSPVGCHESPFTI